MNLKKRNEGITLVALVITIIILLILAGITINSLTGNGLFEKTKLAKEKSENAQIKENAILEKYQDKIQEHIDGTRENNGIKADYKSDGTEIKTNEMIDGKPIYARYFDMEYSGSGWYSKEHNIQNIEKIWIDVGNSYIFSYAENNEGEYYAIPNVSNGIGYKVNKEKVSRFQTGYWDSYPVTLLLKYTKTTD